MSEDVTESWQLRLLSKSLKKSLKLKLLQEQAGSASGLQCLLLTHGDNTGALNYRLRQLGGEWIFADTEANHRAEMEGLLGQPVLSGSLETLGLPAESLDLVIVIDVHEHLDPEGDDCQRLNTEIARLLRPGGRAIVTTPNGDTDKPLVRLKDRIGMTKEAYGHRVVGYTIDEHRAMLREAGLEPIAQGSYSGFFTELIELAINFAYVKVLGKSKGASEGEIAPTSHDQVAAVRKQLRLYTVVFPVLSLVSKLDWLAPGVGYAVSVVARKPPVATDE